MTQQDRDAIERLRGQIEDLQTNTVQRLTRLETILTDEGGKGHEQRIIEIETYVKTHPIECPLIKHKLSRAQIIVFLIAGASLATTWVVVLI